MASYTWKSPISGDFATATNWTPAAVPNDALADVTIDNPTLAPYLITIGTGENPIVRSLTVNAVNGLAGSNVNPYRAAEMEINGTLTFAPGSPGTLGGSLQTFIQMVNGTMINPGTINGFIQGEGNVLLTGTNGFYVTNWLQSLNGIVTVDVKSIAEMTGNTLFDGIYEAQGPGAIVNLGGPRQNLIVNIATIEGPPLIPDGWTELILNGTNNDIGEWNGTGYVGIESTLTQIASRGTFDIIGGRSYNTANTLSIAAGGLLNLSAGTVTTGLLNINGGTVQGAGTINSGVINNGTLRALDGLLTLGTGGLVGTGLVSFDFDQKFGTVAAKGGVMEVHGVGPGQTFVMNGDDTLVLDTPASFAGTIQAKAGDTILLGGVTATTATLSGSSLVVQNAGVTVDTIALSGSYAGDTFAVTPFGAGSTQIKVTAAVAAAAPLKTSATVPDTVSALISQYATLTPAALDLLAATPSVLIASGSGNRSLDASGSGDNLVLDAGSGSTFMTGGSGTDEFFIEARNASTPTYSTITNFHSGENATIFGVSLADFNVSLSDNAGAPGATGLEFSFTQAGHAPTNLVLAGYSTADLTNERLSQSLSSTSGGGVAYLSIHAT